ncbi:MAG: uroporphyrinogen decarboxylase family protein [Spirochaetaceae bacterium]|jgi:uroporphyrinogen decarboxylase|nr:uroporphyrinogen decarboxylase family protein [Spirochaetaceae bacterium]
MQQTAVTTLPPYETMSGGAKKMRDFYALKPDAPIRQEEFGFFTLERWKHEGHITDGDDLNVLFGFDPPGKYSLENLGWCEAGFCPVFEEKVLEDQGDYELVQDFAGRGVRCFKGRRSGFMPEYVDHPVKDIKTWEEKCLWRMDPKNPDRQEGIRKAIAGAKTAAAEGQIICANIVGGYMYLRSLMGPVELLYLFYDNPELIRRCMETWFNLADAVYAQMQKEIIFDELFFGEDICYNHGPLISINMMREFLFPYYQQLITNIKSRQLDKSRTLHFQVDTDGFSDPVIPPYRELGMDYLSPFEGASGCDVVRTAGEYPDLLIRGGFDKRIMSKGKDAIDREVERIMPVMKKRGGYIPTCDHGVPEEVSFENYLHYRKRMLEYAT